MKSLIIPKAGPYLGCTICVYKLYIVTKVNIFENICKKFRDEITCNKTQYQNAFVN